MSYAQVALDQAVKLVCQRQGSPGLCSGGIVVKSLDVDSEKRTMDGVISTEAVDRDREVVVARGLDFTEYRKNPVVLFMHDAYSPIGKCASGPTLRRRNKVTEVVATTEFAETKLAEEVFGLVNGGFVRGISIGMNPSTMERTPPSPVEIRKKPYWSEARAVIRSAEIIEYSFVSIPANADALTEAVSKGLIKMTEPFMEPFIKAVVDAQSRKAIVRVVIPAHVPTVKVLAPRESVVVINSKRIESDRRIQRAHRAGRL